MASLGRDHAALIVVDMQQGFFSPMSAMARIGFDLSLLQPAVAPCVRAVAAARSAGVPVILTRYVFQPGHRDGGIMVELVPGLRDLDALVAGEWEVELLPELVAHGGDLVIDKNRPSAFFNTGLAEILADRGITSVVVCGVTTNCCVEGTVRDASALDLATFVIADAVAETDPLRHEQSLQTMRMLFARMVTVADVEAAFT